MSLYRFGVQDARREQPRLRTFCAFKGKPPRGWSQAAHIKQCAYCCGYLHTITKLSQDGTKSQ
jgi:hypothetical protein